VEFIIAIIAEAFTGEVTGWSWVRLACIFMTAAPVLLVSTAVWSRLNEK